MVFEVALPEIVVALASRYAEYEESGSIAWDRTLDVRSRPAWLRQAESLATARRPSLVESIGRHEAQDHAEGNVTEEPTRDADEEKLVWAAANADHVELEPVEVPAVPRDDGLCGSSLLCDRALVEGISMEV